MGGIDLIIRQLIDASGVSFVYVKEPRKRVCCLIIRSRPWSLSYKRLRDTLTATMIIDFLSAEPVPFSHYKVINGAQEVNNLMVKAVNGRLKGVVNRIIIVKAQRGHDGPIATPLTDWLNRLSPLCWGLNDYN